MDKDYFKKYYKDNRARRIAESTEWQRRNRESRRKYMREYVKKNKARITELRKAKADERNRKRREQYLLDETLRLKSRQYAKAWQEKNPQKRFAQNLAPYGLTPDTYRDLLSRQGGGCAICGSPESPDKSKRTKTGKRRLHVDHCHATGVVRGLLCSSCNLGLGKFGDSLLLLKKAVEYLNAQRSPDL